MARHTITEKMAVMYSFLFISSDTLNVVVLSLYMRVEEHFTHMPLSFE